MLETSKRDQTGAQSATHDMIVLRKFATYGGTFQRSSMSDEYLLSKCSESMGNRGFRSGSGKMMNVAGLHESSRHTVSVSSLRLTTQYGRGYTCAIHRN